jgi:mannose-1-phosphate guanylyltransferase
MTLVPVILSGGAGTRLWPLSREMLPKQLLALTGEKTMLQETAARLAGFEGATGPIIVCNEAHRFLVAEQMREMQLAPTAILLEPEGRNTAPAIALAAHSALATVGEGALLLVLPADHTLGDQAAFQVAVRQAVDAGEAGQLVAFGIVARAPAGTVRDTDFTRVDGAIFARCRSDSVDYAVMEKTRDAVMVPLDAGWNDVGSWAALHEVLPADAQGNVARGDVLLEETSNCYVHADSRLVAALGLHDMVIVETADAVMVAPKSKVQDVKKLVARIKAAGRSEHVAHASPAAKGKN